MQDIQRKMKRGHAEYEATIQTLKVNIEILNQFYVHICKTSLDELSLSGSLYVYTEWLCIH